MTRIHPRVITIDGLSIRSADSGSGGPDALLLAPWPESVFAYEQVWDRLSAHAHLVAVDLPGFGRSEGRETLMNPKAMGGFILDLADAVGLDTPHVVGPDIGTSAVLFAAAAQPDRFRSVVVGSGGAAVPIELGGALKDWVETTDLEPYRRTDGADIVAKDRRKRSPAGTASSSARATIRTGVGMSAHSRVDLIAGAGHFCWEEKPDAYATLITDWWNGGYASV